MNKNKNGILWIPIRQITGVFDKKISGNRIYCCTCCGKQTPWINNGRELEKEIENHNCKEEGS